MTLWARMVSTLGVDLFIVAKPVLRFSARAPFSGTLGTQEAGCSAERD
jgi:hypothetical protein